jgi:hypothetical protein
LPGAFLIRLRFPDGDLEAVLSKLDVLDIERHQFRAAECAG